MLFNRDYLKDFKFLKQLDLEPQKEQYVKIIVLNWEEFPIAEIHGKITGGSITLDGSSSIRRSGSINFTTEDNYYNVLDVKNLISINKKIKIEVGFTNTLKEQFPKYKDIDQLWFSQGVFIITSPNITYNNSGLQIALTIKDKMALLNGECGGVFPTQVTLHEKEDEEGNITRTTYQQIIREVVSEFGGEQVGKIIINNVGSRIKKVMRWVGSEKLTSLKRMTFIDFIYKESEGFKAFFNNKEVQSIYFSVVDKEAEYQITIVTYEGEEIIKEKSLETEFSIELKNNNDFIKEIKIKTTATINPLSVFYSRKMVFEPYEDIGYVYMDFCPSSDLIANAGQAVTTILDSIKNQLGNYEYFYDLEGNFVFQEIKNYLNTSQSTDEYLSLKKFGEKGYLFEPNSAKAVYSFEGGQLVTAYQNAPSFSNIKNDFLVWGTRQTTEGVNLPIRYHLALDYKPVPGNVYHCITSYDKDLDLEEVIWASIEKTPDKELKENEKIKDIKVKDYKTELYLQGVAADSKEGVARNRYYSELKSEWAKMFKLVEKDGFWEDVFIGDIEIEKEDGTLAKTTPVLDYYLDLIEPGGDFNSFMIDSIGIRSKTWTEKNVNCIFEKAPPDIILIEGETEETDDLRREAAEKGQSFYQVPSIYFKAISSGGYQNSAFNAVRDLLFQHTNYNESITLTTLPIYYLEPNTRITVEDEKSSIHGDYMIKTISIPFDCTGTMSITATKALERF